MRSSAAERRRVCAAPGATEARRSQPGQGALSPAALTQRTAAKTRSPATTGAAAWRLLLLLLLTVISQTRTATRPQCWTWTRM